MDAVGRPNAEYVVTTLPYCDTHSPIVCDDGHWSRVAAVARKPAGKHCQNRLCGRRPIDAARNQHRVALVIGENPRAGVAYWTAASDRAATAVSETVVKTVFAIT